MAGFIDVWKKSIKNIKTRAPWYIGLGLGIPAAVVIGASLVNPALLLTIAALGPFAATSFATWGMPAITGAFIALADFSVTLLGAVGVSLYGVVDAILVKVKLKGTKDTKDTTIKKVLSLDKLELSALKSGYPLPNGHGSDSSGKRMTEDKKRTSDVSIKRKRKGIWIWLEDIIIRKRAYIAKNNAERNENIVVSSKNKLSTKDKNKKPNDKPGVVPQSSKPVKSKKVVSFSEDTKGLVQFEQPLCKKIEASIPYVMRGVARNQFSFYGITKKNASRLYERFKFGNNNKELNGAVMSERRSGGYNIKSAAFVQFLLSNR